MINFTVYGDPKALKRHRTVNHGKGNVHIDPSKGDKQDFLIQALANKPASPLKEPLKVEIEFAFKRPKSHFGTGKNANTVKTSAPIWHTGTPDLDNLIKFVCDSLNGIFWHDDSYVCLVLAQKHYSVEPKTVVTVTRVNE